jgi:hypothetical protein
MIDGPVCSRASVSTYIGVYFKPKLLEDISVDTLAESLPIQSLVSSVSRSGFENSWNTNTFSLFYVRVRIYTS